MSIPLFPSLRPNISSPFWLDVDSPIDEEAELLELERGQRDWKANLGRVFSNVLPIGKTNHDADEEDLDDLADDEDDTSSSDDMDDDDAGDEFQLDDSQAPVQAPGTPETMDVPALTFSDMETTPAESNEATGSATLERTTEMEAESSSPMDSASRTSARPAPSRTLAGRHSHTHPQQGRVRAAFIDTAHHGRPTGRPVYSGRASRVSSSGSVSPTSRAYIQAALHSPTGGGPVHLDIPDGEDDTDDEVPDRGAAPARPATTTTAAARGGRPSPSSPSPLYQQLVAVAGQSLSPSDASAQIDHLIESMHQTRAARTRVARAASPSPDARVSPQPQGDGGTAPHEDL